MQDPLNVNVELGGVETTIPLLPEGDYMVQVKTSTVDPNKDKNGLNWNIKLATTEQHTSIDGREVKPGFPFFAINALQARPDSTDPDAFKRSLAETIDAIFGTDKTNRPNFSRETVDSAIGRTCIAHVVINNYQGRDNNKVRQLKAA